jgi:hypothetical protein
MMNLQKVIPRPLRRFNHHLRNSEQSTTAIVVACKRLPANHAIDRSGLNGIGDRSAQVGSVRDCHRYASSQVERSEPVEGGPPVLGAKESPAEVTLWRRRWVASGASTTRPSRSRESSRNSGLFRRAEMGDRLLGMVANQGVAFAIAFAHDFELGQYRLARLGQFGDREYRGAANQGVGVA